MSEKRSTMLFGGALCCAGMQACVAAGQVSDVSLNVGGDPYYFDYVIGPDGYASYFDSSFSASGGLELLPFSQSARGANPYGDLNTVAVDVDGAVDPSTGNGWFDVRVDSTYGFLFGDGSASSWASIGFTLNRPATFSIDFNGFQEINFGSVDLVDRTGGSVNEIWVFTDFGTPAAAASIGLAPGSYELRASAGASEQLGISNADFSVTIVPSPPVVGLLALGGTLAVRRRR